MLNSSLSNQNQPDFDLKSVLTESKLRGLWRLMTGFHLTYIGATLSLSLGALANTVTFLLLRYFVDDYLGGKANVGLPLILVGFLGLALLQGGFTFLSRTLAARTAEGVVVRLRNYLFDHIQRLSFTYHDKTQTGDLLQRSTSDVDTIRRFFADQAIESGRVLLLFLINFAALLYLNWRLALLSVIVVPFVVGVSYFFFKQVGKRYEKYQETESKLSTALQENLSGVRVVKAFARQRYEEEKFDTINKEKYTRGMRLLVMHATFWPITDLLCGAQLIGGFAAGGLMAINGTITIGTYLAYASLVGWIIWPMRNLGRLIVHMSEGLVSFGRVCEVIKQDREPVLEGTYQPQGKLRGELVFDNVSFVYTTGEEPVLQNISFSIKPGQRVALLGSTGSGKTSLVNLLPRFYEYTDGRILLDGVELKDYNRHYLRQQIGIVEQEPFLFSRNVRDNITYGVEREVSQAEVEDAAQAAAIHDVIITKLPEGYDTLVGEKGITLSGGQKQRVALARTLLKDPRILILDDSTSSVDTETEALIRLALQELMKNRTTFIIAHRIQTVMDADLILVMSHGRIVQRGKHAELLAQDGFYRKIYEAQTRIEQELEQELNQAVHREVTNVN
ncbi:MAG: ABC transporter ATP-binding protein [Chloroflexi bacterium]|nr:ABC transporter ATP-binding protein [Chloroflexota bacterium]